MLVISSRIFVEEQSFFYQKDKNLMFPVKTGSNDESEVSIRYSVVQSPCGNVIHTLMNTKEYKTKEGLPFLPGFVDVKCKGEIERLLNNIVLIVWLNSDKTNSKETTEMQNISIF